jgi:hypothetical protein
VCLGCWVFRGLLFFLVFEVFEVFGFRFFQDFWCGCGFWVFFEFAGFQKIQQMEAYLDGVVRMFSKQILCKSLKYCLQMFLFLQMYAGHVMIHRVLHF